MCQYLYNKHHIDVNVESRADILCGPPTTTSRESMQFIIIYLFHLYLTW